jgi:hypothetical protein
MQRERFPFKKMQSIHIARFEKMLCVFQNAT